MRDAEALLELHLSQHNTLELTRTVFRLRRGDQGIVGIRGTQVPLGAVPFKWGPSLHALTLFFTKAALIEKDDDLLTPCLQGKAPSPALNIARLMYRQAMQSYLDIFGSDASGRPNLNRLISVCNFHLKDTRPVQLYLRTPPLSPTGIKVFVDEEELTGRKPRLMELVKELSSTWRPGKSGRELRVIQTDLDKTPLKPNSAAPIPLARAACIKTTRGS